MERGELPRRTGLQRSSPLARDSTPAPGGGLKRSTGLDRSGGQGLKRTTGLDRSGGGGLKRSTGLATGKGLKRTEGPKRTAGLKADPEKARAMQQRAAAKAKPRRGGISPASPPQREKVSGQRCLACPNPACDPAHVIDRSLGSQGQDDPLAVVPLCRRCHDLYDELKLDLLPDLERSARKELAFAVERFGMLSVLRRVTGQRWQPEPSPAISGESPVVMGVAA